MGDFARLMHMLKAGDDTKTKAYHEGRLTKGVHELLMAYDINAAHLVSEELYKVIQKGANSALCMREAIPSITMHKGELRFVLTDAASGILPYIAPGSSFLEGPDTSFTGDVTFVAQKYGEKVGIPEELIEDADFDVIELIMYQEGRRAENTLNNKVMTQVLTDVAEFAYDTTVLNTILGMVNNIREDHYNPDTLILSPQAEGLLLKELVRPIPNTGTDNKPGDPGGYGAWGVREGWKLSKMAAPIAGLKVYSLGLEIDNSGTTNDWATNGTGGRNILVYDSTAIGAIGMRDDIAVESFDDPLNDLKNIKVTMRFDSKVFFSDAGRKAKLVA